MATNLNGRSVKLGMGLEDVVAMSPEPQVRRAATRAGGPAGFEWRVASEFQDNVDLGFQGDLEYGMSWVAGCEAFVKYGRITGFRSEATRECVKVNCPVSEGESLPLRVAASVHLFQTDTGAQAYLNWLPTSAWDAVDAQCGSCFSTAPIPNSPTHVEHRSIRGAPLTRVTANADIGRVLMVLIQVGRVVGEIQLTGPPSGLPSVEADALALGVAAEVNNVLPQSDPYDITEVMAAPLTADAIGCPETTCDHAIELTEVGGSDNAAFQHGLSSQAAKVKEHIRAYGRRASYAASYDVPGVGAVETDFTQYASEEKARAATVDLCSADLMGGNAGEEGADNWPSVHARFDVPGVDDAVGLTVWTDHQGMYSVPTWIVCFPHGSGLARVSIDSDDKVINEDGEVVPESNEGINHARSLAHSLADRLDQILD